MSFDEMIALVPIALLIGLSLYIAYGFWLLIASLFMGFWNRFEFSLVNRTVADFKDYEVHLLHRFPYYDRLPDHMKTKFLMRVKRFIQDKTFEGREDLEVTDEMKTWVAASAVQLTFGLHTNYLLSHFFKIILYPEAYYNSRTDEMHMGEANTRGIIVLSWQDLKEGYSSPNDNFNVGLHEMAHALELQWLLKEDYDSFFGNYYDKWSLIAQDEFENVENERASFFRKYAGTNQREFFAVCIEYFFESGEEFRQRLPEIYYHLSVLLNQDPLQTDNIVKEPQRKSNDELVTAISSIEPVLIPEYAFWSLFVPTSYLILVLFFMVVKGFTGYPGFIYTATAIAAGSLLMLFIRMNKIILYENYLAIRNPFGKIKEIYELADIIGISVSSDGNRGSIQVYQARNGRVVSRSFSYMAKMDDIDKLTHLLKTKKIPIKY